MTLQFSTMTPDQARRLLCDMKAVAYKGLGENLYAKFKTEGGQQTIKLSTRSAASDMFTRLFNPKRYQEQRLMANDVVTAALAATYPEMNHENLARIIGIEPGRNNGIKLYLVRQNLETFDCLSEDQRTRNLDSHTASDKLKYLDNWHLTPDAGLQGFVNLSAEDTARLMKLRTLVQPLTLMAFQNFVEHATTPANLKQKNPGIDEGEVLNFISGWCGLNATGKEVLLNSLSPAGKSAMQAVDVLIKKMIAVEHLPLTGSDGFGLGRDAVRKTGFDAVKGLVKKGLTRASDDQINTNPNELKQAAQSLGKLISKHALANQTGAGCNYIARKSELLQAIRAFNDRYLSADALVLPQEGKDIAAVRWRAYREHFAQEVCAAALQAFYAGGIHLNDDGTMRVSGANYDLPNASPLGAGGEGSVRKAMSASGQSVAIKTINGSKENNSPDTPLREAGMHHIISQVPHKNLVQMHGATHDSQGNLLISMEYAPHGSASEYEAKFNGKKRGEMTGEEWEKIKQVDRFIFFSTLRGLKALHDRQILHRDLKPANIFFGDGGTPKIGDFGRSVMTSESMSHGMPVDSPDWTAPELVTMSKNESVDASPASDIWAAAMMMYTLVNGGGNPFITGKFIVDALESLKKFAADPDMKDFAKRKAFLKLDQLNDQELANQLCHMLHPDPQQRPAAAEIIGRLFPTHLPDENVMGGALVELMSAN